MNCSEVRIHLQPPARPIESGFEMSGLAHSNHPIHQMAPVRILAIMIIGIFLAGAVATFQINSINSLSFTWHNLLDALIVILLVFPLRYFLSFNPFLYQPTRRERTEAE